jgi:NAD-dependent SIR2 family protein deacetylase
MEENVSTSATTPKVKQCNRCGKWLPLSEFYVSRAHNDGLQSSCKDCSKELQRKYYKGVKPNTVLTDDGPLSKYKPVELIAELRRRGYTGELTYVQKIHV